MTRMEMRRAVLDLELVLLEIMVDILTSQMVDQEKTSLPTDQVTGRAWVGREVPSHSPFLLEVPVVQVHLVLVWTTFSQTFLGVNLEVGVSLVVSVVQLGLDQGLNLGLGVPQ